MKTKKKIDCNEKRIKSLAKFAGQVAVHAYQMGHMENDIYDQIIKALCDLKSATKRLERKHK